jgi:ribosomal protein S18 acetylase RimI-like enzyme
MSLQVRLLDHTDYDSIIAVIDDWWGGRHMVPMLPRLFFDHFRESSFIAQAGGDRLGFLVGFLSNPFPHEAYIHFVGVHPEHRRTGIGRILYERFFELGIREGRTVVRSVTSPVNENSIAFHKRWDFGS